VPVEARTKDGELVLRCDLPGVDPSDIDVSLEGTTLTISGERRSLTVLDGIDESHGSKQAA
jgi:HSP20 family protein